MKHFLLLLFACCVLGTRAEVEPPKEPPKEPLNPEQLMNQVTNEVLGLIEVALKVAQYTDSWEKLKALGWVQERLDTLKDMLKAEKDSGGKEQEVVYYEDCAALLGEGFTDSGLYNIYPGYPESTDPLSVWCDQKTDGGGWTVFQRRVDGSENFRRTWDEYSQGFGDPSGEFWLGNDNLVVLTRSSTPSMGYGGNVELRVDITDWDDQTAYARYNNFAVQGDQYTLTAEGYDESSTAGNALDYHNGMDFTTEDRDNDEADGGNCAVWMKGGFWHNYCLKADPNGPYLLPGGEYGALSPGTDQGVTWITYEGHGYSGRQYSLKKTEMKLRKEPAISA